jgi:hypothetical protein
MKGGEGGRALIDHLRATKDYPGQIRATIIRQCARMVHYGR